MQSPNSKNKVQSPQKSSVISSNIDHRFRIELDQVQVNLQYQQFPVCQLVIKMTNWMDGTIVQFELTKQALNNMDPTILATFDDVSAMYKQIVEILKKQPTNFRIISPGTISICITMTLASGIRKKDLILEDNPRSITELQKIQHQSSISQSKIKQLSQINQGFQNQLTDIKKHNLILQNKISNLQTHYGQQLVSIKEQVKQTQKQLSSLTIELRSGISEFFARLDQIQFYVRMSSTGAKRMLLSPDTNSKCLKNKSCTFTTLQCEHGTQLVKKGKDKWAQILFSQPIQSQISFFELEIIKTKNHYICVGICSTNCQNEEDSKWSKQSITLFILDKSIIVEGTETQNPVYTQNGLALTEKYHVKKSMNSKIHVTINCGLRTIEWYSNRYLIGKAVFSQKFSSMCKIGAIKPLLICADEDDEIIIS